MNKLIILAEVIEGLGLSEYAASILKLGGIKSKSEPRVGTGKKPKGSSRRLYTEKSGYILSLGGAELKIIC